MSWGSLAFGLRERARLTWLYLCYANVLLTSVFLVNRHTNIHTEPVNLNYIHYHVHNTILLTMKQGISPGH